MQLKILGISAGVDWCFKIEFAYNRSKYIQEFGICSLIITKVWSWMDGWMDGWVGGWVGG